MKSFNTTDNFYNKRFGYSTVYDNKAFNGTNLKSIGFENKYPIYSKLY